MTMTPYNTDLKRALKWQHNNAPNIQAIIKAKDDWYQKYNQTFWTNWESNVFDLRTANAFGLVVWCIILGIPLDIFDFSPITNAFAFGMNRGSYIDGGGHDAPITFVSGPNFFNNGVAIPSSAYSFNSTTDQITFNAAPAVGALLTWTGTIQSSETTQQLIVNQQRKFGTGDGTTTVFNLIPADAANYNEVGNNFYGGGAESVSLLNEIRQACQLRYVALVSNGRQQWINQMLAYIFNGGQPWNFPGKKYFYLTDPTMAVQNVTGAQIWRNDWQGNQLLYATARSNLLPYSSQIATAHWSTSNCSIANVAGPDGTANAAATVTPTAGGTVAYVYPTNDATGISLNTIYTLSVFVKAGSAAQSQMQVYDGAFTTLLGSLTVSWSAGVPSVYATGGAGFQTGTAEVEAAGVAGWYRISFGFNTLSNATLNSRFIPDATNGTGTCTFCYPQGEVGAEDTAYIPTTSTAAGTQTDYTLNTSTGAVVMGVAPVTGATLTWQGAWNWSSWTSPSQFGTGNGANVNFTLTNPPGGAVPVTKSYYMEYRVGANMGFSSQFLNILNNPAYGIMPTCAGTAYAVVQES